MKSIAVALAAVASLAAAAQRYDWADFDDDWARSAEYESSKAVCRSVRGREPPAPDRPTPAQAAELRGCSSEALYYGIGMPADPERARLCAFVEVAAQPEEGLIEPLNGRVMLMTIYANGRGASRDLDLAIRFACGVEPPVESHDRVTRLAELRDRGWTGSGFHYCDDVTTNFSRRFCAIHEFAIAEGQRQGELSRMMVGWTADQRAAFPALIAALDLYAGEHAAAGDMTGTGHVQYWISREESVREGFIEAIRRLERDEVPSDGAAEHRAADVALNSAWRELMRNGVFAKETSPAGATRGRLREAQRAWIRYRDAFLAFSAIRYPQIDRGSIAALLTRQRTDQLLSGE